VNRDEYTRAVVNGRMVEEANRLCRREQGWFMRDGAPAHTAAEAVEHLPREMQNVPMWPPNAPDFNPIEMVWDIIGRRLAQQTFATVDELCAGSRRIGTRVIRE
jgi:transposase